MEIHTVRIRLIASPGFPMSPSSVDSESLEELRSVAWWFQDAKVESQEDTPNVLRCVDEDRFAKWQPFLKRMKLYKQVYPQ
ncbi:hypothetical protein N7535_005250 [Penicillium sp. DV-2018c]|nr:hypothetical protein N7461_008829 [Penicillium sp. DV-2018c]KAJ5571590.1 hypothetical protein N7535_005250 [Penicillium sp. DV-2018c]